MFILTTLKDSVYNPDFYRKTRLSPAGKAVKYFFIVIPILAFIVALFSIPVLTSIFSSESITKIVSTFPENLTITIKNGAATTNVEEPYVIKNTHGVEVNRQNKTNLLVIDTQTPFTAEQFDSYNTTVLLKKDFVVTDNNGKMQITPLKNFPNVVLNRAQLASWGDSIRPYFPLVIILLVILITIAQFIYFCLHFVYLLIAALIIWLIGTIRKFKLRYGVSYKLGIYMLIPLFIVRIIAGLFGLHFPFLLFTLLLIVLCFVNFRPDQDQDPTIVQMPEPVMPDHAPNGTV
jgi:hypothetical protein